MAITASKILVIQGCMGPDYLADMLGHYLYNTASQNHSIVTNQHPLYLFDDFPSEAPLYGKGFTVYRRIPAEQRSRIRLEDESSQIPVLISNKSFDLIVWTSIRRCSAYFALALQSGYEKDRLIVIDGEDDSRILKVRGHLVSEFARLYKRELTVDAERRGVLPISFKFPSQHPIMRSEPMRKTQILAGCDPRFKDSYVYGTEDSYYANYRASLFAFTTQKAGWDCCRHYEILASNCIPVFPDIIHLPESTMKEWSRGLQFEANSLWDAFSSVHLRSIDAYIGQWTLLNQRFQNVFRGHMLTDSYKATLGF